MADIMRFRFKKVSFDLKSNLSTVRKPGIAVNDLFSQEDPYSYPSIYDSASEYHFGGPPPAINGPVNGGRSTDSSERQPWHEETLVKR